jgi:hypothetical protein
MRFRSSPSQGTIAENSNSDRGRFQEAHQYFRFMGRRTLYEAIAEMQTDLEVYQNTYNRDRSQYGPGMNGKTPAMVLTEGL